MSQLSILFFELDCPLLQLLDKMSNAFVLYNRSLFLPGGTVSHCILNLRTVKRGLPTGGQLTPRTIQLFR
jgi:hypothetical protein